MSATLAALPSVDSLLISSAMQDLVTAFGRQVVVDNLRDVLTKTRQKLRENSNIVIDELTIVLACEKQINITQRSSIYKIFNLTGTVLHTNLGRALLPDEAINAIVAAMRFPCNLEYDLETGGRGDRDDLVVDILRELTGAEDATVVNNNAAGVLLTLNSLALRKEVIVSRGELVEIGGAFRVPDIMSRAGAKLIEVGTTNRTHLKDFAEAISPKTSMLMKIHWSNYAISGFTAVVPETELANLAHQHQLPYVVDLGSGTLTDLSKFGLPHETTVQETMANGADLVLFSGDKLLGGPQAGIIVGRHDLIQKIKKNPLKRCLRVGKITMAALESVLRIYRDPDRLANRITTLRLLTRPQTEIKAQATRLQPLILGILKDKFYVNVALMQGQIGSGALPIDLLPSAGLAIKPLVTKGAGNAIKTLQIMLRNLPMPVIGYVRDGALNLDFRCLEDELAFTEQLSAWII